MADGQPPAVAAAFPDPPPYWKHFTEQNLARANDTDTDNDPALRYLVPPAPPTDGRYKSFGVQHDLAQPDASLSSAGITQLYPSTPTAAQDPTARLLSLSRAALLNFLELVGTMATDPSAAQAKTEDLQTIFYNAHDIINQYRPHQARESLILMMEDEVARAKEAVAEVERIRGAVGDLLRGMVETGRAQEAEGEGKGPDGAGHRAAEMVEAKRRVRQRAQWAALDAAAAAGDSG